MIAYPIKTNDGRLRMLCNACIARLGVPFKRGNADPGASCEDCPTFKSTQSKRYSKPQDKWFFTCGCRLVATYDGATTLEKCSYQDCAARRIYAQQTRTD